MQLTANYKERIDAVWHQQGSGASEATVGADGSFHAKLPAGRITVYLHRPPQPSGSIVMFGMSPEKYRLEQRVEIPGGGTRNLQLKARRIDQAKVQRK